MMYPTVDAAKIISEAKAQPRWVLSMCILFRRLPEHLGEKCLGIDAMRRIVRARVHATLFLQMRAQIAGSGFLLDGGLLAPSVFWIVHDHFKGMQINISVRAIPCAQAATDAPILDDHFQRISPANRAHRAAHHTQRIAALPAAG